MLGTERYLSRHLFTADFARPETLVRESYSIATARQVGFQEKWLQDAIIRNPEIVLAPCREANLIREEERWCFWAKEVTVADAGSIDVLLLSSSGRVSIVETKLSYNHEARRTVVAQILEYAINFSSIAQLPVIPTELKPTLDEQDVRDGIQKGDYLLIIAGDQLDSRAVKLSQALLAEHLVRPWALALIEVAVFEQATDSDKKAHLLVPHIRGTVVPVQRQVVTIDIQGDRTKIEVGPSTPASTGWNEERFFAKAASVDQALQQFAEDLRRLRDENPDDISLAFGHGATPSVTLRKRGHGILTLQIDRTGSLTFNPPGFALALGQEPGSYYLEKLQTLFPHGVKENWAYVKLNQKTAERELGAILALLREVLTNAPIQAHSEVAASS